MRGDPPVAYIYSNQKAHGIEMSTKENHLKTVLMSFILVRLIEYLVESNRQKGSTSSFRSLLLNVLGLGYRDLDRVSASVEGNSQMCHVCCLEERPFHL
jgi:hypothetical protein